MSRVEIDDLSLPEFRCTRNLPYLHECIGKHDVGARQGHYVRAESEEAARDVMAEDFPNDAMALGREAFTVTYWGGPLTEAV